MFYPKAIADQVAERCHIFYVDHHMTFGWNENRRGNDLRLVTGYCWEERGGQRRHRAGFKTRSAAMRDAFYLLVEHREQPLDVRRPKLLRVVAKERAA